MYCNNCGKEIPENSGFCPECGAAQKVSAAQNDVPQAQPQYQQPAAPVDNGGFGWGLLGCCIPIVGLILFLVWKGEKPKTAKTAGIGALVGVGITVLFYLISFMAGFASMY